MRIRYLPLVLLIGCGDNHGEDKPVDAKVTDAAPDAPIPLTCAYTEMSDATNDDLFGPGGNMPEATMLSFTKPMMICGKLDNGHYEMNPQRIDVDSYKFTVPAMSYGLVSLTAPGAENYDSVFLEIYGMTTNTSESGQFIGTFAVTSAELPPGDYIVTVQSYDATAPTAAIDYKLVVDTDSPTRCAKSTATPTYTEAMDGLTADGNDVIEVRYSGQPRRKLTDNPLDVPEPTGVTVAPGMSYRIAGTNAKPTVTPASWADSFQDRDVYLITMGANSNQLSVRLNWTSTTVDFDYKVFPVANVLSVAGGLVTSTTEDEFQTFAVKPNTTYWLWVGAYDGATGLPATYDATLCAETFTP